jgi:hypothetical protein
MQTVQSLVCYLRFFRCFLRGWLGHGNPIRCCLHPSSYGGMLQWQRGQWFAVDSGSAAEIMQTLVSYNAQHTACTSADCGQSLSEENYKWNLCTWILSFFPNSSSHFQGPSWPAWRLEMKALWSFKMGFTHPITHCHILEDLDCQ